LRKQLHEIVNNTPEGQRLLQEKKRKLEEEAGGTPREERQVFEASSVGGEENT